MGWLVRHKPFDGPSMDISRWRRNWNAFRQAGILVAGESCFESFVTGNEGRTAGILATARTRPGSGLTPSKYVTVIPSESRSSPTMQRPLALLDWRISLLVHQR